MAEPMSNKGRALLRRAARLMAKSVQLRLALKLNEARANVALDAWCDHLEQAEARQTKQGRPQAAVDKAQGAV